MSILSCSASDCEAEVFNKKRQLCKRHYNAWYYREGNKTRKPRRGKVGVIPAFTCEWCGAYHPETLATSAKKQKTRKYCGRKCNAQSYSHGRSAKRKIDRLSSPRYCLSCGVDISARDVRVKFCTDFCRKVARGVILIGPRNQLFCALPECRQVFTPFRKGVECCSENHGQILYNRRAREAGTDRSGYVWSDRRKAHYHKRRALKALAPAEDVRPAVVYDRDSWICGLCSLPVDPSSSYPDPMSASLDHVLPLSRGGHHTYENTQLAHLSCNVRKGADVA